MTRRARRWIALLIVALVAWLLAARDIRIVSPIAGVTLLAIGIGVLVWAVVRLLRRLLWRVGRRLAFSYFLIGVLPIPMVLGLALLSLYLLGGFLAGHLYRDAVADLRGDLAALARARLAGEEKPALARPVPTDYAIFRDGKRLGDRRVGETWPEWLGADAAGSRAAVGARETPLPVVALADGTLTVAVAVGSARNGVVALYSADAAAELTRRAGLWVELTKVGAREEAKGVTLQIGVRKFSLARPDSAGGQERAAFFRRAAAGSTSYLDHNLLLWAEVLPSVRRLSDGAVVDEQLPAILNATPRQLVRALYSPQADVDASAWAALVGLSILLLEIYLVALVMAAYMIYGLSRAVNRLSVATQAVQAGDFGVRIPVKRKDQLGELQRNFNRMAENLDGLISTAAQKEALEKELAIARELQASLLPTGLGPAASEPAGGIRFATFFEPSAAIGGDYFDVLRLDQDRLAVIIADVSGHGLPAGLRMAMLKAALVILVEDGGRPEAILNRLHDMVRAGGRERAFVTATLGFVDLRRGSLELVNAGHPPTYVVRGPEVREVLLPGNPLGGLGRQYGRETLRLERGDVVVWLSDGLIEAQNPAGEPFGYERIQAALAGPGDAEAVRDRLLAAVRTWSAGTPVGDDRTLLVMRYAPVAAGTSGESRAASPRAAMGSAT